MDSKTLVKNAMYSQGRADAIKLQERAVAGEADGTEVIANEHAVPEWRQRDYRSVPIGAPYKFGNQVYKLWQQHDATNQPDWTPEKAVSLWDYWHTTDPAHAKPFTPTEGARGAYKTGEVCLWTDGKVYRSTIDGNSYTPEEYPAAWEVA